MAFHAGSVVGLVGSAVAHLAHAGQHTPGTLGRLMAASSMAYAAPNVIARATAGGSFSVRLLLLALLSEPLFWAGMVTLWGAIAVWIYRRRHAA